MFAVVILLLNYCCGCCAAFAVAVTAAFSVAVAAAFSVSVAAAFDFLTNADQLLLFLLLHNLLYIYIYWVTQK